MLRKFLFKVKRLRYIVLEVEQLCMTNKFLLKFSLKNSSIPKSSNNVIKMVGENRYCVILARVCNVCTYH